jgi:iron complex transport system permease protein
MKKHKNTFLFSILVVIFGGLLITNLCVGSIPISISDIWNSLFHSDTTNSGITNILTNFRIPKTITACVAGAGLAVAGQLMQTLFANPLAGPYVLGISSGAGLGVALLLLGSSFLPAVLIGSFWTQIVAAIIGALLVMVLVLGVSTRTSDTVSLLLVGMMFGSIAGAIINVLQSISNPESLKMYIVWSMGSIGAVTSDMLIIMVPIVTIGLLCAFLLSKKLNALLLGKNYALGLGISIGWTRTWIILVTCIIAATITAFTGPIAFIGMAVPHLARGLFKTSNHFIVLPACILLGASLLLLCDSVTQLPVSEYTLPINAISSLIGAPIILWVIIKNKHLHQ